MKLIFYIIAGALVLYLVLNRFGRQYLFKTEIISPVAQSASDTPSPTPTAPPDAAGLKSAVENALAGSKGVYGVVIKNFKTGESYTKNELREFEPGSLYKIWVMATVYKQIQDGILPEAEILSEDIAVLNRKFDIASEAAELSQGSITLSVAGALEQMITISHNYAALLLSAKVRLTAVEQFLKDQGLSRSKLGEPPITTPGDIALFLEKLYRGDLADEENTQKMTGLLKRQKLNSKIPKYLPNTLVIAHKTGEIGSFTHDAGIVYTDYGDYLIVLMSESDNPAGAEERIADISRAVYGYFAGK